MYEQLLFFIIVLYMLYFLSSIRPVACCSALTSPLLHLITRCSDELHDRKGYCICLCTDVMLLSLIHTMTLMYWHHMARHCAIFTATPLVVNTILYCHDPEHFSLLKMSHKLISLLKASSSVTFNNSVSPLPLFFL